MICLICCWDLLAIFKPILTFSQSSARIAALGFVRSGLTRLWPVLKMSHATLTSLDQALKAFLIRLGFATDSLASVDSILNIYGLTILIHNAASRCKLKGFG